MVEVANKLPSNDGYMVIRARDGAFLGSEGWVTFGQGALIFFDKKDAIYESLKPDHVGSRVVPVKITGCGYAEEDLAASEEFNRVLHREAIGRDRN